MTIESDNPTDPQVVASPDTVGAFPIRTDATVLPDEPDKHRLNWVCYMAKGFDVYKVLPGAKLTPEQRQLSNHWPRNKRGEPIYHVTCNHKDDLREGDEVLVKTMFDNHWAIGQVVIRDGKLRVDTGGCIYLIEFDINCPGHPDKGDQKTWYSFMCINKACFDIPLSKVQFE
jgi:hypothetical protein